MVYYYGKEAGITVSIFESIIYGFVSGFSEFLPASSQGHQAIMFSLFGMTTRDPLRDLLVHIAVLLSFTISCKPLLSHMRREQVLAARRKGRRTERRGLYDLRLVKAAGLPLLVGLVFYILTKKYEFKLLYVALFFVANGVLLLIPEYIRHGNKDARFLTGFDGLILGISGALSVFPGISRVSTMHAYGIARGADRNYVMNWILILSVPALFVYLGFDIFNIFAVGINYFGFLHILGSIISAVAAFAGGYFGIRLLRFLTVRTGFAGFAYYSWGAALFTFILYLIV